MVHKRSVYTFMDLLGDVGGLFDALHIISGILVTLNIFVFGDPMNSFLLQALFFRQKSPINDNPVLKNTDRVQ